MIKGELERLAHPGDTVTLQSEVSDPDHDTVNLTWWQYNDAGTYPGDIAIADASAANTSFRVPSDAKAGQTIQVVLEATDNGTPRLTQYQRVIVTVQSFVSTAILANRLRWRLHAGLRADIVIRCLSRCRELSRGMGRRTV